MSEADVSAPANHSRSVGDDRSQDESKEGSLSFTAGSEDGLIVGYVLAGGYSRRMGVDKSQIDIDGRSALIRQVDLLSESCKDRVVVVGHSVIELAPHIPVIPDRSGRQGPLDGLITALHHAVTVAEPALARHERIIGALIVAVDLWNITTVEINTMINVFLNPDIGPDTDVVHLQGSRAQPLAALWRVGESLEHLSQAFAQGERSVIQAWEGLRRSPVVVPESVLANINTPEDVAQWKVSHKG